MEQVCRWRSRCMIDGNGSVTEQSSYRALQNSPHFQGISCFLFFFFSFFKIWWLTATDYLYSSPKRSKSKIICTIPSWWLNISVWALPPPPPHIFFLINKTLTFPCSACCPAGGTGRQWWWRWRRQRRCQPRRRWWWWPCLWGFPLTRQPQSLHLLALSDTETGNLMSKFSQQHITRPIWYKKKHSWQLSAKTGNLCLVQKN